MAESGKPTPTKATLGLTGLPSNAIPRLDRVPAHFSMADVRREARF